MLRNNIQMTEFITQLKLLLKSAIVKRDKLANAFETDLEQHKIADKYINTIDNGDQWDSYVMFDRDVLIAAGIDATMVNQYVTDKEKIPREMRAKVISLQKQYIIDSYVEKNDYYRMLHGEPSMDAIAEHEEWLANKNNPRYKGKDPFVYCPENEYDIPTYIPVHELNIQYISIMDSLGIIEQLKTDNPDKPYLDYLGKRSIDYYTARTTNNYGLLYAEVTGIEPVIRDDFINFYGKARAYYMMGFYNREYSNMFLWYDEFIGFCIIVMATQRVISNIYNQGLTRDFYDTNLIKYLFQSHSIPYIQELDIRYQRALAKDLNRLLRYKATDKVLYDVAHLLGFYDVNIYKYYLVKSHVLDEDGIPVFPKKRYKENGEYITVPDYEKMYRFHFQQINLKDQDINTAMVDKRYTHDYDDIILQDPYWVDDSELKQKIYETEFNHIVSKYMSLDVMIKMVEMMYEITHTVRFVIDCDDFKRTLVNIPVVTPYDTSLYDLIIFICALYAHKCHLPGTIPIKGYQIANVYGFNFKRDIQALIEAIYDTKELHTGDILFAEDTQMFYMVRPGKTTKIPNHFKNTLTGTTTDDMLVMDKPLFQPLDVIKISHPLPMYDQGDWYQYNDITDVLYQYVGTEMVTHEVINVATLSFNLVDNNLATYIKQLHAVTAKDVGTMYKDVTTLRKFIVLMLEQTTDKDVYYQYEKLYRALLVTEDVEALYKDRKGNVRKTFEDLLKNTNPDLYTVYLRDIDSEKDLNNDINAILSKISSFGEYKYLANINRAENMFDTVLKLLRFFKSYTVDFINSGIQYVMTDKYFQGLKLMDDWEITDGYMTIEDKDGNRRYYKDLIQYMQIDIPMDSRMKFSDSCMYNGSMWRYDKYGQLLADKFTGSVDMNISARLGMHYDNISLDATDLMVQSRFNIMDSAIMEAVVIDNNDKPNLHDSCSITVIQE